ncbi:tetratricopeptide repeat domain protein [Geomonas sp. Red276]
MKKVLLLVVTLFLAACAPTLKMEQHTGKLQLKDDELPRQVAILPFSNATQEPGIDAIVRRNFANHFSSKAYLDVKLPVVDEKLVLMEKTTGKKPDQATPAELSAALGADGLLYGKVTDYNRVWAGVYSQFGVEAEVWLVNARTGKEVFRFRESVRYHEGGIPTSPLSIVVTAVSTAMNLREIQKVRMVNELCYKFMEKIPAPQSLAQDGRPRVKEVLTNAADGPFGPRKVIHVGLEGEPGLVGSFDIGSFKKGIPMKEVKPGIYSGEYAVLPGDTTSDMPITVTLSRPGGYDTTWVDPGGYVAIDTTPPPPVASVKVKGYADRVELNWEPLKNVPDLKGYRVLRSDSPLSGYQELGVVEVPSFVDGKAEAGKSYYYRVASFDRVGNQAEPGDGVRGGRIGEPQQLSGVLNGDTVLEGSYRVTASVTVPKGITLTINGDSRLYFAPDAGLLVQGRLVVKGGESPVLFIPAAEGKWAGISLDGGGAAMTRFNIKGAVTGVSSKDAELQADGGVVTGCQSGLAVSGMPAVDIRGMNISGNVTGLKLTGTAARVTGSLITQNKDGIVTDGFSGEIRDNNLVENETNIRSDKPLAVGPNWFGSVQADALKLTQVSAAQVYDARVPGGALVAPVVDPYQKLTPEERQRKGTEFLIEAGSFFRQRNYGKASGLFQETLKLSPSPETYYYLSLCHQEMQEQDKAMSVLKEGTSKYSHDPLLWKSLGMLLYEKGDQDGARKALEEVIRLSPEDRQAKFVLKRLVPAPAPAPAAQK